MADISLIWASFKRQKSFYLLWIVCLAMASTGLMVIDVYRQSLGVTLKSQGRKILGADISISSRKMLSESEKNNFLLEISERTIKTAEIIEMFAMVSQAEQSRLALVKMISDEYPLAGNLEIKSFADQTISETGLNLKKIPTAWVAADLLTLFDTRVGSEIQIGKIKFSIAGVIHKDPSQTFRLGSMAPRIYIHRQYLEKTGLLQFGSTFSNTLLVTLSQPISKKSKIKIENSLKDPGLQITTPEDLELGTLRVLSRLLDFLGLIGLISLCLGWLGVYFFGRRWLIAEQKNIAVLKCLGLSAKDLSILLLKKLLLTLFVGSAFGALAAWTVALTVEPLVKTSLPADFTLLWTWNSFFLVVIIGPLAGALLLIWSIFDLVKEKPIELLREANIAAALAISLLFALLTVIQARSWLVSFAFFLGLIFSIAVVASLCFALFTVIKKSRVKFKSNILHLASAIWLRRKGTSFLLIVVASLSGLLAQLIPHIEASLVEGLRSTSTANKRPALFMVDIQDEQLQPLKDFLASNKINISSVSPFVRARILTINQKNFERSTLTSWSTREEEVEARFRNRGVNLTYRKHISPSENITSGKPWDQMQVDPVEISVEEAYAKRLNLKIGDIMKFDIQGVELDATIASLRTVKWDSFEPNFFIQFPEGVLDLAPKTWIMTLNNNEERSPAEIQTLIAKKFPNVTSINTKEALGTITEVLEKLSSGLRISSNATLILGISVFLMILIFQIFSSQKDWQMLSVIGMSAKDIWWLQLLTYGGLCLIGSLLGSLLSMTVSWGLFHFAFNTRTQFDFGGMLQVWLTTWAITIVVLLTIPSVRANQR